MAGLALAIALGLAARDVGRPGAAEPAALLVLRAVGGLGLVAMAALGLRAGAGEAALVAAVGAVPLLIGLTGGVLRPRERPGRVTPLESPAAAPRSAESADDEERRAA